MLVRASVADELAGLVRKTLISPAMSGNLLIEWAMMINASESKHCRYQALAYIVFIALVLVSTIIASVLVLLDLVQTPANSTTVDLILDVYREHVRPEPLERLVFAVLATLIPISAFVFSLSRVDLSAWCLIIKLKIVLPFLTAMIVFLPLIGSDFTETILGYYNTSHPWTAYFFAAAACFSIIICSTSVRQNLKATLNVHNRFVVPWLVFVVAIALQSLSWRWVSFASVTRSGVWSTHADPVLFPVSQVVAGRTILRDIPSQYGMFPELVAPLFKLVGLSVFSFSSLMIFMQLTSLMAIFYATSRLIRSRGILSAVGLTLVLLTFETVLFFIDIDERYFQYWPIRFFWPAVSVLAFYLFVRYKSFSRSVVVSIIATVATIWNVDSGIFIILAFGAFLFCRMAFILRESSPCERWGWRSYLFALGLHTIVPLAGFFTFWVFLDYKSGHQINYNWMFEYQKIFVDLGLMMLPLPRQPHPWMSVLAIYLLALIAAFYSWRRVGSSPAADMSFYLSILGLGLFVYYLGRSHVLNLVTVCWPSAILIGIAADNIIRAVKAGLLPRVNLVIPVAGLTALLIAAGSFLARVPFLASQTLAQFNARGVVSEAFVADEIALIRKHSTPGQGCLIFSQRQGIYHAESQTFSPMRGPGIVEILLKSDHRGQRDSFLDGRYSCVFLGVGGFSDAGLFINLPAASRNYDEVDRTPDGSMRFLRAKP